MDGWLIALIIIGIIVFAVITVVYGVRAHRLKVDAGREELVGRTAEVKTTLNPKGTVFTEGEIWSAVSDSGKFEPGDEVVITKVDGLVVHVAKKA